MARDMTEMTGIAMNGPSTIDRRRFLTISAAAVAALGAGPAPARPLTTWQGIAMGARATIALDHPEAAKLIAAARDEIARLEAIFSLYRAGSALSRLNRDGVLIDPPFEMLELFSLAGAVHAATGGLFDPTVQPLWAAYAEHHAKGKAPPAAVVAGALARVGWAGLRIDEGRIGFARPGMAITLNGIAQGYVADRVAALLRARGLRDVLVDTGEIRALGRAPDGTGWPVTLVADGAAARRVSLSDRALATSAPLGTVLDAAGRVGHILDPLTGMPAGARWRVVSVAAASAALADALSTGFCLMERARITRALGHFPDAELVRLG